MFKTFLFVKLDYYKRHHTITTNNLQFNERKYTKGGNRLIIISFGKSKITSNAWPV